MELINVIERLKGKIREEFTEAVNSEGYSFNDILDEFLKSVLKEIITFNSDMAEISNSEILEIIGGK